MEWHGTRYVLNAVLMARLEQSKIVTKCLQGRRNRRRRRRRGGEEAERRRRRRRSRRRKRSRTRRGESLSKIKKREPYIILKQTLRFIRLTRWQLRYRGTAFD